MPAPPTGPTGFLVSCAMELPFRDGRLLVAAKPVEAAAAVHQPSRGTADDGPDLLDAPDGPVRRNSAAVRLGQQCRPAALLCVRADRLCGRGLTDVSLMLGMFTRLFGMIGALQLLNIWLGLYNASGEWPWTALFLIVLQLMFAVHCYGRSLGVDALLTTNISGHQVTGVIDRLLAAAS